MDIDTSGCKFESDDVQYFTFGSGNGYVPEVTGLSSIFTPTKTGFRIYMGEDIMHNGMPGWLDNQYRIRIGWVGIGSSSGPKSTAVCCGTAPSHWGSFYQYGTQEVSGAACNMKGTPVWITAAQGGKEYGTSRFLGSNAGYNVGQTKINMLMRGSEPYVNYWGYYNGAGFTGRNAMFPRYCMFGEPFPSGDQSLDNGEITQEEYPCDGMRVVSETQVVLTNTGKMCCGKSDTEWSMEGPPTLTLDATNAKCYADRYPDLKAAFGYNTNALIDHWNRHGKTEGRYFNCGGQLSKTVDTSACNFKNDNVVYITSVGGVTDHWR
jgi:hypothetical protein